MSNNSTSNLRVVIKLDDVALTAVRMTIKSSATNIKGDIAEALDTLFGKSVVFITRWLYEPSRDDSYDFAVSAVFEAIPQTDYNCAMMAVVLMERQRVLDEAARANTATD